MPADEQKGVGNIIISKRGGSLLAVQGICERRLDTILPADHLDERERAAQRRSLKGLQKCVSAR
jgi:hypothetical protein